MIESLLIANRGEIAVRIMRTCRRLGIRTIAVYSDADRDSCHVAFADEAVRIGPAAARESYLRADAIMDALLRAGGDAIHPGYGFLSEKPDLPRLCAQAERVFVGPSAECIEAMGPKIGSKLIAKRAGVPSVPGYVGDDQSIARLTDEAERISFPLMVKASAGGGGKGMRRVFDRSELAASIDLARREAEAAFGDPSLLIEKLVTRPRHLELQIAGDKHGNVVHLFERDCSIQRNNQKLIEEAPAPNLDPKIRNKLYDYGVTLARAINYDSLGTVEFILEEGEKEPWFLEMNTRLQVEHTVTEAVTGFDLVEWQIRIASGEPLAARQEDIECRGHAIEARVTAERADSDFRPDAGPILAYHEPESVRIDSGVAQGSTVSLFYDSLLAKVIAEGSSRDIARLKLAKALRDFAIIGPATTIPFLVDVVEHPIFAKGEAKTSFIADAFPDRWVPAQSKSRVGLAASALLAALEWRAPGGPDGSAWSSLSGYRILGPSGGVSDSRYVGTCDGRDAKLTVQVLPDGSHRIIDEEGPVALRVKRNGSQVDIEHDGHVFRGAFVQAAAKMLLMLDGQSYEAALEVAVGARQEALGGAGSGVITAPMPGVVAEVPVAPGHAVRKGDVVVVLESMKLFSSILSDIDGVVVEILCQPGQSVPAGKRLAVIEAKSET
jgi:3-methylcrotonyl-CoA carboxylase alpha subunit